MNETMNDKLGIAKAQLLILQAQSEIDKVCQSAELSKESQDGLFMSFEALTVALDNLPSVSQIEETEPTEEPTDTPQIVS